MKKKCIFWITIVPLVLILVLCGLTVIYFEFLYYDPDVFPNSSRQPEEGGFLINPATILQSLNTGNTDVFSPYFEQTEGPTNVFIDKSIDWIPNDYLVIAEALNNKVWGDSLNDWKIYEMVFLLRCKEKPRGFEKSHLIYFKTVFNDNGRKEYVIREFFIEPKSAYVMWRGGARVSRPLFIGWKSIDLGRVIDAIDILKIAEENGGKDSRLKYYNNCGISLSLTPEMYNGWQVWYSVENISRFEITIDSYTGKILNKK